MSELRKKIHSAVRVAQHIQSAVYGNLKNQANVEEEEVTRLCSLAMQAYTHQEQMKNFEHLKGIEGALSLLVEIDHSTQ